MLQPAGRNGCMVIPSDGPTIKTGHGGGAYSMIIGGFANAGGGCYQTVRAVAGAEYTLTVTCGADTWWLPYGEMRMIWLNDFDVEISRAFRGTVDPAVYGQNFDIAHPWAPYSLVATAPAGTTKVKVEFMSTGSGSVWFENAILTEPVMRTHDPVPAIGNIGVLIDSTLSWTVPDPNGVVDPNLTSMKVYLGTDPNTLNLPLVATITTWNSGTLRASCTPSSNLSRDTTYYWRVDSVMNAAPIRTGYIWTFATQKSVPEITVPPVAYKLVDGGATANISVTATSISPMTYQWYKYVNGVSDTLLTNVGDISGATTATLSIANAEVADEGRYYCIVNNGSGIPTPIPLLNEMALLGVKRRIAYWDFESGINSTVPGSPVSVEYGTPVIVPGAGVVGAAMVCDANAVDGDMIYTDLNAAAYFDICDFNMTVACWVKSTSTYNWYPLVARNGEEDGWQLRQGAAGAEGDDRPVFSTRGLAAVSGGDDGSPALKTAFDGNWHYVVGTYDGAFRKLYVDGVLQKVWWLVDGLPTSSNGDAATGFIAKSASGVSIAGRYGQNPAGPDTQFTAGTYDEVEIYNYALSAATIAQTYANITATAVCPSVPAYDFDGNCKVNLNDFALFASQWLVDNNVQPVP
jgi:hypothetical protein